MTDPTKTPSETLHDNPAGDSPATDTPSHEEALDFGTLDPVMLAEKEKAEAQAEALAMKDRAIRALAELENVRKRAEREVTDARTYGISSFARDMLNVADNLRRALDALPEADRPADGPVKAFVDGVDMTERELLKTLEKHGVKRIEPDGQRFDPNLHQAMFQAPNPDVPNGTVIQTVQAGYVIGDRVLRPALVGVSTGGPKVQKPAEG